MEKKIKIVNEDTNLITIKIFFNGNRQHDPSNPTNPRQRSSQLEPIRVAGRRTLPPSIIANEIVEGITINDKFPMEPGKTIKSTRTWTSDSINVVAHEMSDVAILDIKNNSKKDAKINLQINFEDSTSIVTEDIGHELELPIEKPILNIRINSDDRKEMKKEGDTYTYINDQEGIDIEARLEK
ncbi:MAG: hypothetical protein SGI89_13560 [bacterium]|nr:hypothetical protein [bacterium]